jgi:hypothetical protein
MKKVTCLNCGCNIESDFIYCPKCGVRINRAKQKIAESDDVEMLRALAEGGDSDAQNALGYKYDYGTNVKCDPREAARWFKKSAEQNNADGLFNLGRCYYYGYFADGGEFTQDFAEAARLYKRAAELGNLSAMCNLAYCYLKGNGVKEDKDSAFELYLKAASSGDKVALYCLKSDLSWRLNERAKELIAQSKTLTEDEIEEAAKAGDGYAQNMLGDRYERGYLKRTIPRLAFKWYKLSAENNYFEGLYNLARCYYYDKVFKEDGSPLTEKGDEYGATMRGLYKKSAEQGYPPAIEWYEDNCMLNKIFAEEFLKLCQDLSELPEDERNAFFHPTDDDD